MATQLDRIEEMLRALCDHLGVHVTTAPPTITVRDLASENGHRHDGTVSRFEHGWGFIDCPELGRNFFVHHSDVEGNGMRLLEVGEGVSFEVGPGKDGRSKAVRVRRQPREASSGEPEAEAVSGQEAARGEPDVPEAEDRHDEEDDMPQPESSAGHFLRSAPRRTTTNRLGHGAVRGRRQAISW